MQYQMKENHEVDITATYRHVINSARGEVEMTARNGNADIQTKGAIAGIFDGMARVFDVIETAKNQAYAVAVGNPELNDKGIEARYRPIIAAAIAEATSTRDRIAADIASLEKSLEAATKPKLPAGADVQMQLLNAKQDMKMLFDSINEHQIFDSMLEELAGRIKAEDEIGVYLLANDRWPVLYLQSRGRAGDAFNYSSRAAATLKPLQSEAVQVQATILSFVNAPGSNGLKSLLANIDQFLSSELPALAATNAHSWSVDGIHRI